jgi:hypothetical protein
LNFPHLLQPRRWPSWRKIFRVFHRDLGYFFFGATIVYAVSGIALNHRHHWNPNYSLQKTEHAIPAEAPLSQITREEAAALLRSFGIQRNYLNHYAPQAGQMRIFFQNGHATLDAATATATVEILHRRPLLHLFNQLHYNPGDWWTWFADAFSVALIIIAITGLFLVRGKYGISRRGAVLVTAGIVLPGILVAFNI